VGTGELSNGGPPRQAPNGKAGKLRKSRSRKARKRGAQNVPRGGACRGAAHLPMSQLSHGPSRSKTHRGRREAVMRECYSRNAIRLSLKPLRYVVRPIVGVTGNGTMDGTDQNERLRLRVVVLDGGGIAQSDVQSSGVATSRRHGTSHM
jgi:hypothetical protein